MYPISFLNYQKSSFLFSSAEPFALKELVVFLLFLLMSAVAVSFIFMIFLLPHSESSMLKHNNLHSFEMIRFKEIMYAIPLSKSYGELQILL